MKTLLLICCLVLNTSVYAAGKDDCKSDGVLQAILSLFLTNKNLVKIKPVGDAGPTIQSWIQSWKSNIGKDFSYEDMKPVFESLTKELGDLVASNPDPNIRKSAKSVLKLIVEYNPNPNASHLETERLMRIILEAAEVFRDVNPMAKGSNVSLFDSLPRVVETIKLLRKQSLLGYYRVTDKELMIRDINDLSPYPIYPVGFSKKPLFADNILYGPVGGIGHDLGHGGLNAGGKDSDVIGLLNMEKVDLAKAVIARKEKIYKEFRVIVEKASTKKQKEILELLWFDMFHERSVRMNREVFASGNLGFGNRDSLIERVMERIRKPNDFGLNFTIPVDSISAKDISDALVRLTKLGVE